MNPNKIDVIGVGVDGRAGLSAAAREAILNADQLWGTERFLREWDDFGGTSVPFENPLKAQLRRLADRGNARIAILASGDPGFFGIAATLLEILPAEELAIHPNVSSLQAAFARAKIPWQEAVFTSLHTRPFMEVIGLIRRSATVGMLTDPRERPNRIAERLLEAGVADCEAIVCENLGTAGEKLTKGTLAELTKITFAPLNVMILRQGHDFKPYSVGVPRDDSAYLHRSGMITKRDIRLLTLDRLSLRADDTVWDIGAGSGALSIEIAERSWRGRVYAIEKDPAALDHLRQNVGNHGALNVEIVSGRAPEALLPLPAPTAVFIGGSGGELEAILSTVFERVEERCRLAANFTLLENLVRTLKLLRDRGLEPQLSAAGFSYAKRIGSGTRFEPNNPIYILSCEIGGASHAA